MALDLNKDSYTYAKDYEGFIQELKQFHTSRGTPFARLPQLCGLDIDLYLLYRRVIALGGWQKVNDEGRWEDIQEEFRIPRACPNGSTALKQIYIRYLDLYEKVRFLGEDPKYERNEYEGEASARKKSTSLLHGVPLTYNTNQHVVSRYIRQNAGMSSQLYEDSDYVKLEKAFLCGLPNEVDFAMNVCLLLSNEGKHIMKLNKSKHLLELMLANVGIFSTGLSSYQSLSEEGWSVSTGRDYVTFWYDTVDNEEVRALILPLEIVSPTVSDDDVLNLKREIGINDVEGQRILQMAVILRNLSFEADNCGLMASDPLVFRFLILCSHSKYGCLKQIGLDTLGNLASKFVLSAVDCDMTEIMLNTIRKCLVSADKFEVVRGLEILSKLCQLEKNEDVLSDKLGQKCYEDIVQLLTIHDIQLIVYTLEALYQLSEIGEMTTSKIAAVKHAVDVLVSLTTVEAQSYGPNSLVGIKVVEYVPPPAAPEALPGSSGPPPTTTSTPQQTHSVPRQAVVHTPSRPAPAVHQPIAADSEGFAKIWLNANYEYKDGSSAVVSIYSDYLAFCGRIPIKDVVTSSAFIDCLRSVFPKAERVPSDKNGSSEVSVRGLVKRALPSPVAIPPQGIGQKPLNSRVGNAATQVHVQPPPSPSSSCYSTAQGSPQMSPSTPYTTPQHSPNRPMTILQKQLQSPPQNSPTFKKGKKNPKSKFPSINKALHGDMDSGSTNKHNGSPNRYPEVDTCQGSTPKKSADSNMIKTLLAKKLNENIIKQNAAAAALQANEQSATTATPTFQEATPPFQQPMPSYPHAASPCQQTMPPRNQDNPPFPQAPPCQQTMLSCHLPAIQTVTPPHPPAPFTSQTHGATAHRESLLAQPPQSIASLQQHPCNPSQQQELNQHLDQSQQEAHPPGNNLVKTEAVSNRQSPCFQSVNDTSVDVSLSNQALRLNQPEVCGEVENAKDIVQDMIETEIQRIENQSVLTNESQMLNSDLRTSSNNKEIDLLPSRQTSNVKAPCESDSKVFGGEGKIDNCLTGETDNVCPMEVETVVEREEFTKAVSERLSPAPVLVNGCQDESSKDSDLSFMNSPPPHNTAHIDNPHRHHFSLPNGVGNGPDLESSKENSVDSFTKEEILARNPSVEKAARLLQTRNGIANHLGNGDEFVRGADEKSVPKISECSGDKVEDSCDSFGSGTGVYRADTVSTAMEDSLKPGETTQDSRVPVNGVQVNGISESENSCGSDKLLTKVSTEQTNGLMEVSSQFKISEKETTDIGDKDSVDVPSAMDVEESPGKNLGNENSVNGHIQSPPAATTHITAAGNMLEKTPTAFSGDPQNETTPKVKSKHSKSKSGSGEKSKKSKSSEKKPKSRKRSRSNASQGEPQSSNNSTAGADVICQWDGCKKIFELPRAVFCHAYKHHLVGSRDGVCKWEGCDKLQRQRWSLVTHVQDHHCSEHALRLAAQRRQQAAQATSPTSGGPPPAPNTPLVYPPDAAIQAIRRFSARPPFQELVEPREGPVTKHIRLTASLVLRNLARYSAVGRSLIKRHEQQMSYTALSAVESSSALANCLWAALHDH